MSRVRARLGRVAPAKPLRNLDIGGNSIVWHLNLDQVESQSGRVLKKEYAPASEAGSSTHWFDDRYVLYSKLRPYLNKVVLPDELGVATTELVPMFPEPGQVDRKYLAYYLRSKHFVDWVSNQVAGAKMPRVSMKVFWDHEISLPTMEEQQRIATILDKVDALRQKRQRAIELADQFLRSMFLEMFGDPVSNPKGWPKVPFRNLVSEFRYGSSQKALSVKSEFALPILRIPNVSHGVIDLHDDLKFVELPATEIGRLKLKKGDLLFVRTNGNPQYIGRCAVFDDERDFLFASYLIRARLKESTELTPNFIQYCLSVPSYRSKIVKETRTTAGNFNINTKGLGALELIVPSRERLGEFEKIQARVKRLLERLQEQAEEADALFNSLSQSVFESQGITKRAV